MMKHVSIEKLVYPLRDEKKMLKFIEIPGLRFSAFPLRLTLNEWETEFRAATDAGTLYTCHTFTMVTTMMMAGDWDYCEMYEIACPLGRPQNVTFGPHKTDGLAMKKALEYLVKYRAIEIVEERS